MKKLAIAAVLAVSTLGGAVISSTSANAVSLIPIRNTIKAVYTSNHYNMDTYEKFQSMHDGETYNIHASSNEDGRILIMETYWSPIPELTSGMNEEKAHRVGLEYAESNEMSVKLVGADKFYFGGSYGWSFKAIPMAATQTSDLNNEA